MFLVHSQANITKTGTHALGKALFDTSTFSGKPKTF